MHIVEGNFSEPVIALLKVHLHHSRAETAPGSAHALDLAGLQSPDVTFWTVWEEETLLGMGALKRLTGDHGEIKSMHTVEAVRQRGIASLMLRHIMDSAKALGMSRLSLKTGSWPFFEPARRLYLKHGFVECPPFGAYVLDLNSVFMTLTL